LRFESTIWSAFSQSMTGVRTTTQIITIGGGPRRPQRTAVLTDVEFQDLMATDGESVRGHNEVTRISPKDTRLSDVSAEV
jgi:hypothetical protein